MGISISHSEASRETDLTKESRRMKRRDVAVSEILQPASDRYSSLDVKQNSHSVQGECVALASEQKKSSKVENEEISSTAFQ